MKISQLIEKFRDSPKWTLFPPTGLPQYSRDIRAPDVRIPDGALRFYELCGGLETIIRGDDELLLSIAPPAEFDWAIGKIFDRFGEDKYVAQFKGDISWHWHLIGYGATDEYLLIDLSPERYERCYLANFYFFGQKGRIPIVATSFEGLLQQLYRATIQGEEWSWNDEGLGDAYD